MAKVKAADLNTKLNILGGDKDKLRELQDALDKEKLDQDFGELKKAIKDLALKTQIKDPLNKNNIGQVTGDNKKDIIPERLPLEDTVVDEVLGRIKPDTLKPIIAKLKDLDESKKKADDLGFEVKKLDEKQEANRKLIHDAIDGALKEYEKEELLKRKKRVKDALKQDPLFIDLDKNKDLKPLFNGSKDDDENGGAIVDAIKEDPKWLENKDINGIPEKAINKLVDDNGDGIIKKLKDTIARKARDEMDGVDPTFNKKLEETEGDDLLKDALSEKDIDIDKDLDDCLGLLKDDKAKKLAKFVLQNSPDKNVEEVSRVLAELKLEVDKKREEDRKKAEEDAIKVIKDKGGRKPDGELPNLVYAPKFKINDSEEEGYPIDLLVKTYKLPLESLGVITKNIGKDFIPNKKGPRLQKLRDDLLELEKKFAELQKITIDEALIDDGDLQKVGKNFNDPKKKLEKEIQDLLNAKLIKAKEEVEEEDKEKDKFEPNKKIDNETDDKKEELDKLKDATKNVTGGLDFFELGAFHTTVIDTKNKQTPDLENETTISLAYCRDELRGSMPDPVSTGKTITGRIYPKLVVDLVERQSQKNPQRKLGVFTLGEDHGVSYGTLLRKDKMEEFPNNIRDGYAIHKALSDKIAENINDIINKAGKEVANLLSGTDSVSRSLTSTIPIKFIDDNQGGKKACYSIGVQKNKVSDKLRKEGISQATVTFTGEPSNNDPNIQYIHIPGTGGDSNSAGKNNRGSAKGGERSLKLKVQLVSKEYEIIDDVEYKKGDIVIHKNPFIQLGNGEFKELTRKGRGFLWSSRDAGPDHCSTAEENLMDKMQVTAVRQIGIATKVANNEFRESIEVKQMAFFNKGNISRTGDLEGIEVGINEAKIKYQTNLSQKDFTTTLNRKDAKVQFEAPKFEKPDEIATGVDTKFTKDNIGQFKEKIREHNEAMIKRQQEEGVEEIKLSAIVNSKSKILDVKNYLLNLRKTSAFEEDKNVNIILDLSDEDLNNSTLKNRLKIASQELKNNKCKLVGLKAGDKISLDDLSKINEGDKKEKYQTPFTPVDLSTKGDLSLEHAKTLCTIIEKGQVRDIKISKIGLPSTITNLQIDDAIKNLAKAIIGLEDKFQYCKLNITDPEQKDLLDRKLKDLREKSAKKLFVVDIEEINKAFDEMSKKNTNKLVLENIDAITKEGIEHLAKQYSQNHLDKKIEIEYKNFSSDNLKLLKDTLKDTLISNIKIHGQNLSKIVPDSSNNITLDMHSSSFDQLKNILDVIKSYPKINLQLDNLDKADPNKMENLTKALKEYNIGTLKLGYESDLTSSDEKEKIKPIKNILESAECKIKKVEFTDKTKHDKYEKEFNRAIEITGKINKEKGKEQILDLTNIDHDKVGGREKVRSKIRKLIESTEFDLLGKFKEIKFKKEHITITNSTTKGSEDQKKFLEENKDGTVTLKPGNSPGDCKAFALLLLGKENEGTQSK